MGDGDTYLAYLETIAAQAEIQTLVMRLALFVGQHPSLLTLEFAMVVERAISLSSQRCRTT